MALVQRAAVDYIPLEIQNEEQMVEPRGQEFPRYDGVDRLLGRSAFGLHAAGMDLEPRGGDNDDEDGREHFILPAPRLLAGPRPSTFRSRVGHPDGGAYGGFGSGGVIVGLAAPAAAPLNLEKVSYGAGAGECTSADSTVCAICIQDYEVGDELSVVPCSGKHRFHAGCIAVWVARKRSCPLCPSEQQSNTYGLAN